MSDVVGFMSLGMILYLGLVALVFMVSWAVISVYYNVRERRFYRGYNNSNCRGCGHHDACMKHGTKYTLKDGRYYPNRCFLADD